jgi:hypothetical protein
VPAAHCARENGETVEEHENACQFARELANRPSPPRATGARAGTKRKRATRPCRVPSRSCCLSHEGSRSKPLGDVSPKNGRWQVFGLTSASAFAGFLGFVASRSPCGVSACDEVRSRVPLRGSPGFEPGSLLSLWRLPQAPTRAEVYVSLPHVSSATSGNEPAIREPVNASLPAFRFAVRFFGGLLLAEAPRRRCGCWKARKAMRLTEESVLNKHPAMSTAWKRFTPLAGSIS